MEWQSKGFVIGHRRFGEAGLIMDVFTEERGKQSGLVYGGAGSKKRPSLEIGNLLDLEWRARLDNQLGHFASHEVLVPYAVRQYNDPTRLAALTAVMDLLQGTLPEGHAYEPLFAATEMLIEALEHEAIWPALYVKWEVGLLDMIGYGLDLDKCALTGVLEGLSHVSPRTGRAICGEVEEAKDYLDKLIPLPAFLMNPKIQASPEDILKGLKMTGYFLSARVFGEVNRGVPESRGLMIERMRKSGLLSDLDETNADV